MTTYQIEIIQPLAKKLLDDLAALDLIKVRSNGEGSSSNGVSNGNSPSNRQAIADLAGAWGDMSDSDFDEYLTEAKRTGDSLFDKKVD